MASLSLRCALALLLLVGVLECARAFSWRAHQVDSSGEMFQLQEAAIDQLKFAASPEVDHHRRSRHHTHRSKRHGHHKKHQRRFSPITSDTKNDDKNLDIDVVTTTTVSTPTPTPSPTSPAEPVSIQEAPFMAAVLLSQQLWCSGAIVDADKVLTAAHCLQLQYDNRFFREYTKLLSVRVGSSDATAGGEVLDVTDIYFHPNYKPETLEFNLAVLRISKNLTFRWDSNVEKIEILREDFIPNDNNVTFLGWGDVSAEGVQGLQRLELPVYDSGDCQELYGKELVTRNHFCAGFITLPKNVCNHGAGGAALLGGRLAGLLSFSSRRCGPDQPAVFTATGPVATWLDSVGVNTNVKDASLRRFG